MSSVFAQVWFWALLAFLVGALLTWVLLVRPEPRRGQTEDRRVPPPADRSSSGRDESGSSAGATGTAVWPSEPAEVPVEEAGAGRPRARWLESDSLQGLSTQVGRTEQPPAPGYQPPREDYPRYPSQGYAGQPQAQPQPEPYGRIDPYADRAPYAQPEPYQSEQGYAEDTYAAPREESPVSDEDVYGVSDQSLLDDVSPQEHAQEPASAGYADYRSFPDHPDEEQYAGQFDVEPSRQEAEQFEPEPAPLEEPPSESGPILPKRQRGATNRIRGGFEPPRPIQPSVRPVVRRNPDDSSLIGGSLFEPTPAHADEQGAYQPPPARSHGGESSVPPGPFGPGSAMPTPGGGRPGAGFTVKASVTALRYCTEDSPQFPRMVAEVWFASAADAERVGFRPLT